MPIRMELMHLIHDAQALEFWAPAALGLIIGGAAVWWAFTYLQRMRLIEDTPTALVRSAPQGYIELQGHAELMDGDPIHAPLSLRHCTWYRFKVERREKRGGGNNSRGWRTIDRGVSEHLFYLEDATGRCAIDPEGAAVTATHRNIWYGSSRIPGRYHVDDGAWWARTLGWFGQSYRYIELRIEPGDPIYVLGNFITHCATSAPFDKDAAVGELLRDWKRDREFMLRQFDANGDGEIDMDEWAAARERAEDEVLDARKHTGDPPPVDLLGRTADRRRPFIIAAGNEAQAVAHCRRRVMTLASLGLPLLIMCAWAIAIRLAA
ncbi:MAG: GIDE domain-containing protein [Gammaproteobacteria bacterium]